MKYKGPIIWDWVPMPWDRFEGVAISKTGVPRRDPRGLMKSPEVQEQLRQIKQLRINNMATKPYSPSKPSNPYGKPKKPKPKPMW